MAYQNHGLEPPRSLWAHSTRGMATSWALFRGISVSDIRAAVSWPSPHTFIQLYRLSPWCGFIIAMYSAMGRVCGVNLPGYYELRRMQFVSGPHLP